MPDPITILRLETALDHINAIKEYIKPIKRVDDFYSKDGSLIQDAVLMRLQALGENIKTINKKDPAFLQPLQEEIISIIRFRDLLSHHYDAINLEIVFNICTQHIPRLKQQTEELLNSYK